MAELVHIQWFVSDKIGTLNGPNPLESPAILQQLGQEGHTQVVTVRPWSFTMAWSIPDFNLRNFMVRAIEPSSVTQWDQFRLNEFCVYELAHGRRIPIWFEDAGVRNTVVASLIRCFAEGLDDLDGFVSRTMTTQRDRLAQLPPEPLRSSGCHYCYDSRCRGDVVCHTTTVESAIAIVNSGRILSACRAKNVLPEDLARDPGNAAGDPPDYFEYVMFGSGNCSAVDKLVLEHIIGHVPSWEEFEARFQPGVRFYFRSADLHNHPDFTLDGIHEKIYGELELEPWLVLMVVPEGLPESGELINMADSHLPAGKVASLPFSGVHYREWARMVYGEATRRALERLV